MFINYSCPDKNTILTKTFCWWTNSEREQGKFSSVSEKKMVKQMNWLMTGSCNDLGSYHLSYWGGWGLRCIKRQNPTCPVHMCLLCVSMSFCWPSIFLLFKPVLFLDNHIFQQLSCGWTAQISGPIKTNYQTNDLSYSGSFRKHNRNEQINYLLPLLPAHTCETHGARLLK